MINWPPYANKDDPPWSHVVLVEDEGGVRLLTAGAEFHGRYARPGPHQSQHLYAAKLATEHNLPHGAIIHILRPTNNPASDYCGYIKYRVGHEIRVELV